MTNKKLDRLALNDAYDWSMMPLLQNDIAWKTEHITGYHEAFNKAMGTVDLSDEAKFLAKMRKKIEKAGGVGVKKNRFGKLKTVLVIAGVVYVANELGYLEPIKKQYRKAVLGTVKSDPWKDYAPKGDPGPSSVDKPKGDTNMLGFDTP